MENFNDEFGDLSEYKILSFEEITQGFEGNKNPLEGIARRSFEEMSAFKNSPFKQYWEKRIPEYAESLYGESLALGNEPFKIFDLSKKLSQGQARFYETLVSESWEDISFIVYANPDGKEVLKEYTNSAYSPADNEILFFIETDDGKFDFGKIVRVKLGAKAREKMKFQFPFLGETDEEELADEFLKRPFAIKNNSDYNFIKASNEVANGDTSQLKKLLAKAIKYDYDQRKFDDISWSLLFLHGGEYIGLNIPKKLMSISQKIRNKKYNDEKYWNAFLEKGFTPAFLPQITVKEDPREETIKKLLEDKIDELFKDENDGVYTKVFKELSESVIQSLFDAFYKTIKITAVALTESYGMYSLNAFLVGFWNGCLEFTAGIIDLIALVIMIEKDSIGYVLSDALGESLENLMNDIVYNFKSFIKKLWNKFIYGLEKFPDWFLKYGTNPYFWYKELGELTPDIIFIILPALKAGRTAKLAEIGKVSTTVAEETTEEVSEKIIKEAAEELSEKLEKKTAQREVKESFDKAERELEDRIPKEREIEEVKVKGVSRKKVRIANIEDIGKPDNKVVFKLIDDAGKEIGELIRGVGTKGRSTTYKLKFSSGKRSLNLKSEVTLYDSKMARSANLPVEGAEQIIYGDLNIPVEITSQYSGLGELMLDDSLAYFKNSPKLGKVDGNIGYWVRYEEYYKDYGGQSVNLKKFWEAVDAGKSYEEAAFETFTGQWAKKNGFTKVVFDPNKEILETEVVVKFLKE